LKSVPVSGTEPEIVIQISSIATLGQNDKWLDKTLFEVLKTSKNLKSKPKFHVIFPTADEIRRSLNGYASGSAIRMLYWVTLAHFSLAIAQSYLFHYPNC
jgi:tyrosyl-DNA phosphodiesterase 1